MSVREAVGAPSPAVTGYLPPLGQPMPLGRVPACDQARPGGQTSWKLLTVLGVGVMLLIGGCSGLVLTARNQALRTVDEFYGALERQDHAAAAILASGDGPCEFVDRGGELADRVLGGYPLLSHSSSVTSVTLTNGKPEVVIAGEVVTDQGADAYVFLVVRQDGEWVICRSLGS